MLPLGEMGRSPAQLLVDWLAGRQEPEFWQATGKSVTFTQSGQAAILLATRIWGIGVNDHVLVPAYNCGSEISPLAVAGAEISMYRVDGAARIDLADLLRRVTSATKLVYVTHYFGRPTEMEGLVTFCRERNIKLLEDCALSLFSQNIGRIGDAAVFSFRKSLPAFAGGALVLCDTTDMANHVTQELPMAFIAKGVLSLIKKWGQRRPWFSLPIPEASGLEGLTAQSVSSLPELPALYYCSPDAVVYRAPRVTLGLLRNTNAQDVVLRRRENYNRLKSRLAEIRGITFLWEEEVLPDGMCPLGLPLLVDDKTRWCKSLAAAGIRVAPWWAGCHRGLDWSAFPEAVALKARLILLPVHQDLNASHIDFMASVICSLATAPPRAAFVAAKNQRIK
jgi:dTDP-4-amino-4,6-dideoxygalactose transaminase